MNLFSIIWLGLVILLGFLEALTVTLTSIWFAVGAMAAMAVALFGGAQKVATNADRIIGQKAMVTEPIDNVAGTGAVSIGGTVWTARSDSAKPIAAGSVVRILRIEGVKVLVAPVSAAS